MQSLKFLAAIFKEEVKVKMNLYTCSYYVFYLQHEFQIKMRIHFDFWLEQTTSVNGSYQFMFDF